MKNTGKNTKADTLPGAAQLPALLAIAAGSILLERIFAVLIGWAGKKKARD